MKIGIDGNEANQSLRVGAQQYALELLRNIYELDRKHEWIIYLKNNPGIDLPKERKGWQYRVLQGGSLWIIKKLSPRLLLNSDKLDLFFSPSHYVPLASRVPLVCSVMDLGYLEFSDQFKRYDFWQLKYWTAWSLFISKKILAISNSTKDDILKHYPFAKGKIEVTLLGFDQKRFNPNISKSSLDSIKKKLNLPDDFILCLGTLKPSKNIEGLLVAFSKISDKTSIKLVIAGRKGWLFDSIYKKVTDLDLKDRVLFTDFVSEEDKPALISQARVLVSPSFWEGFGLHVLEAMACGVPVVVSNAGSLPEVVGKAGILIDPHTTDSIAQGLFQVINSSTKKYNSLVRLGLERSKKFSWQKTAQETIDAFESVK